VQQIHFQAGVVGHGGQAGDAGGVAGLDDGILDEGGAGLVGIGDCKLALLGSPGSSYRPAWRPIPSPFSGSLLPGQACSSHTSAK
jgi:hypothetical protein